MRFRWISLAYSIAFFVMGSVAQADWQYTRWGMTPDQVVAASGGKATLLAKQKRLPPLLTAATGTFQDGALALHTTFVFDISNSGLRCVYYGVADGKDNAAFEAALIARFGRPQEVGGLPAIGMKDLGWTTSTDQINAHLSNDSPAFVEHCGKQG